ncbi:cell division protein FtsX [Sphingosinicella sp.]|uniref:cell division protein FtsX n=1 Tax=Sphingosinicella sp. TaxID=1917971 RepID=UPI0035B0135B
MIAWLQPRAQRYRFLPEGRWAGGALPWIIGMMTFLATLALAGGMALSNGATALTGGLSRSFTVQIVEPNPDLKREQTAAVAALLRARADLADVVVLGDSELRALVEPWLGSGNIGEELPLPAMIDARWKTGTGDMAAIGEAVRALAPTARIDTHAQWFRPLAGVVEVLKWLAVSIGVLVVATTAAIVALSVRAALSTHGPTIETLHIMGAEDRTVAALFEYRYAIQGLVGGAIGAIAGLAVILFIGNLLGQFGGGLAGEIGLSPLGWTALAAVPLLVALLTIFTVRITVGRRLRQQL